MYIRDLIQLNTKRTYTDEGFLKVPARIGRTGVQDYTAREMGLSDRDPNDKVIVYRPEEEVFSDATLNSFGFKPVTNNHPPELLDAKNAKKFSVGMSDREVMRDGDFMATDLNIFDADSIDDVESGKAEVSNGYTADIDFTPGLTPNGMKYDAIQRNIRGNHIAIVTRGRAGSECRLADSLTKPGEKRMNITIDGVDFEVTDQVAQAVGKMQKENKDLKGDMSEKEKAMAKEKEDAKKAKEDAKKTNDALTAQLDAANEKTGSASLDKAVTDRMMFVDNVRKICPGVKWEGKDTMALMKEVVSEKCQNIVLDEKTDAYITSRFDILIEDLESNPQRSLDEAMTLRLKETKDEDTRPLHVIAREKHIADSQNAWKKKA